MHPETLFAVFLTSFFNSFFQFFLFYTFYSFFFAVFFTKPWKWLVTGVQVTQEA